MAYPLKMFPISKLKPYEANARTHPKEQIDQLKDLILMAGFVSPILYDFEADHIIAGHGRVIAAQQLMDEGNTIPGPGGKDALPKGKLPCVDGSGMTEAQRRAFIIADNQVATRAGWDQDTLVLELQELEGLNFDLARLGFEVGDLHNWLTDGQDGKTDPDEIPEVPDEPISKLGDVWVMGDHRIVCGDSTDAKAVELCLDGASPHLMVTDPPYGVEYDANWRNEADRANGKLPGARAVGVVENDDRADWSEAWALFPGDVAYVWHAGNKAHTVAESLVANGLNIRAQIIWNKSNMVISRGDYHPKHEPCWYAVRKGKNGHYVGGRKQTTVWDIDKPQKSETGHSTQKPVECMKRPIENNSKVGDAVYEPFSGSGTTIIAGEMTGRRILAIELNPAYVDIAVRRWQNFTGESATLDGDGRSFSEVEKDRVQ